MRPQEQVLWLSGTPIASSQRTNLRTIAPTLLYFPQLERREEAREKKECWKRERPFRLESCEVLGTLAKLSPIKGLWGLPETLGVAQVMSPSKGGPSWPNFEVKGEVRKRQVPAGMARDLFAGLQLAIRPNSDTFQEINYFSSWQSIRQRDLRREQGAKPLFFTPRPFSFLLETDYPQPCSPNATLHL